MGKEGGGEDWGARGEKKKKMVGFISLRCSKYIPVLEVVWKRSSSDFVRLWVFVLFGAQSTGTAEVFGWNGR